jgi:peptidyl-prolyl cis-trans isomerase C
MGRLRIDDREWINMARRNRWLVLAGVTMVCAVLAAGGARAQLAPAADPSPLAPGDLKRPIFDTRTPVYGATKQQEKSASTVVAEVDGRAVTLGDVADAIQELPANVSSLPFEELFPGILSQLVRQEALAIRAQRQGLDEDPAVRRKMRATSDRVLVNALLEKEASGPITEAALLERYSKDVAGRVGPEEVRVRVIMMPTEQEAVNIIAELKAGADFATIAKRSSKDATALVGGDAGFVPLDGLTVEVGAVVFSMQPGQLTPFPVRSVGSWFVLRVEERRRQATRAFSVVRADLRRAMLREAVPDVVKAAMADVTIREYETSGKETDATSGNGASRILH